MKRELLFVCAYVLSLALGTALSAATSTNDRPVVLTDYVRATVLADTLPPGRHQVSTFRNGSSTEFIVEDGEIVMLKVDGKEIPESEYDKYQREVEIMLGGGQKNNGVHGTFFDVWDDAENLDDQSERIERYFEKQGEHWEQLGEEFARRFEEMFQFDNDEGTFRFYLEGEEGFEVEIDSIMRGHEQELRRFERDEYKLDDIIREREERDQQSTEEEIEELSTMIERMEARKAQAEARLEEDDDDSDSFTYNGIDFKSMLQELRSNGDIEPGVIRSFEFSNKSLKVNGERVDDAVFEDIMTRYRRGEGAKAKFDIELDGLDW